MMVRSQPNNYLGTGSSNREPNMPLFMYQAAYSSDSWAAQVKNPQNRVETVGRQLCEAAGGKFIGGWLCFGEYDLVLIADVPNNESMAAIAMAVAAGGKARASKTTPLITGAEGVAALRQADAVAKAYKELDMKRSMAAAGR
jgi:uncharacterized protein with GYD domain